MAGKAPRPNKNSDGQAKKPAANPTGGAAAAQAPQGPPSLVPPGGPPSMDQIAQARQLQAEQQAQQQMQQQQSAAQQQQMQQQHGNAMQMQQLKGDQQQAAAQARAGAGGGAPTAPAATPSAWPNNAVRESLNFKDLPPMAQAQVEEQEGLDPSAPLKMIQQQLQSSMTTPAQGPVPQSFIGPMVPPGLEGLPHDMAQLTQVMQRGFAPGSDNGEHEMALNAHAMAKASIQHAQNSAADGAQQDQIHQALGGLLQHLGMTGQLPSPGAVADHVHRHSGAPQVASSY